MQRSVTTTSRLAIGDVEAHSSLFPAQGDPADFVILFGIKNLRSAVLNPSYDRTTIHRGEIVSRRRALTWTRMPSIPARENFVPWQQRVKWRYMLCPPYFLWKWIRGEGRSFVVFWSGTGLIFITICIQLWLPLVRSRTIMNWTRITIHALTEADFLGFGQRVA